MNREKLIEAGVDYDDGVERFCGKPEIYEKYLKKFFQSGLLSAVESRLASGDISGAFRATHDLKSSAGSFSLSRCYTAVCTLTEQLREQYPGTDYIKSFLEVKKWYEKAKNAAIGVKIQ